MRSHLVCLVLLCLCLGPGVASSRRQEILLRHRSLAEIPRLVAVLQEVFPKLEFIVHPVLTGFYVMGPRDEILAIKAAYPEFDVEPEERYFDAPTSVETLEQIHRVFPEARVEGEVVRYRGSPYEAQILEDLCRTGKFLRPDAIIEHPSDKQ